MRKNKVCLYCILSHAFENTAIRSLESRCIFCGIPRVLLHESLPVFITTSKFSRRTSCSVWRHLLLDFAIAKPNNFLEFVILKFKSSENLILETEYSMQTSRNLRNSDRTPGTVEKRVSVGKTVSSSRSLKTNVLHEAFSMTYRQSKAETTFLYWILLAIN